MRPKNDPRHTHVAWGHVVHRLDPDTGTTACGVSVPDAAKSRVGAIGYYTSYPEGNPLFCRRCQVKRQNA